MDPALKARLTSRDLWMRLLYMILFAIAYGLAELLMTVVVMFQFVFILITGGANEPLLRLGQNLTRYIADIIRFQTFNSEEKPFPFADWPEEAPGGERWREPGVGHPSESTTTVTDVDAPAPENSARPEAAGGYVSGSGADTDSTPGEPPR